MTWALVALPCVGQAQGIGYVYDDLDRLIAVIDPSGDTATYSYDAVGNLLSIARYASSAVTIIHVSPGSAAIGATVTIAGTGFSTTPANNTVSFNGTSAAITSATATQLVVTVPVGATTGTIAITAPAGSTTSAQPFVIGSSLSPTITSFTPTIAAAGTAVTITGTNFETVATNDKTRFNTTFAAVGSATATTLGVTVPTLTGSGRLTVMTPNGTAVSANDFHIPPAPFLSTDVGLTGRIAFATSTVANVATANKIGLFLFDAVAGQRVSLYTSGVTSSPTQIAIYAPDTSAVTGPSPVYGSAFTDVKTLPAAGTYSILIDPYSTTSGSATLMLYNVPPDVTGTISAGQTPAFTVTTPGQAARYTFSGTASQRVAFTATSSTIALTSFSILAADGTIVAQAPVANNNSLGPTTLPATSSYTLLADPFDLYTGAMTVTMYDVPADLTGTVTPGGSAITPTFTGAFQNGSYTFSGTNGQRISLQGASGTFSSNCDLEVSIANPSGGSVGSTTCMGTSGFIDVQTLSATGTYTVKLNPQWITTGNATLTLHDVPGDPTTSLSIGGATGTLTTTVPGQNAEATFSGTASQQVTVHLTNDTYSPGSTTVTLRKPDGTQLTQASSQSTNFDLTTVTLPTTGTYTVFVNPPGTTTGSIGVNVTTP